MFVPGLLPGERALVRIVKPEKRYAFGRVEKLLERAPAAPSRSAPSTSAAALRLPAHDLRGLPCLQAPAGAGSPPAHRRAFHRGAAPFGAWRIPSATAIRAHTPSRRRAARPACGFFAPRSHDLVPLPENGCAIQGEASAKATQAVLNWMRQNSVPAYDEQTGRGLVRHIMTRSTTSCELMVVVVVTRADIPKASRLIELLRAAVPGLCSVCLSVNSRRTNASFGHGHPRSLGQSRHGGHALRPALLRFAALPSFQVNPQQTEETLRPRAGIRRP